MGNRKFVLAVKTWGCDEAIHSWKFLKSHILQTKDAGMWKDELVVVHVAKGKREKEPWDQGGAVISSLKTALAPYKHDVFDLEGDPGPLLVDIANKEQADILVLATRGRNVMKKAMMGSITEFVMLRVNCACLVIKPQIGAGDTYRMKSAAQPQGAGAAAALQSQLHALQPPRSHSPGSSPMYRMGSLPGSTPFNRRVAIAYDTTASGRYLLKWAADNILEPTDNVFVVRAVPNLKLRKPGTSFADKNNVQRLAKDALPGFPHVTTFNLQQGNARKSVLSFVAKESVDVLIIGLYKPNTRRKGLALRGNAIILSNRCACPCLVVPMSETALQTCVKATDLELAAAEEEELESGSETDSEEDEHDPGTPIAAAAGSPPAFAASGAAEANLTPGQVVSQEHAQGSPEPSSSLSASLRGSSAAAIKQIRAPLEALFKDFKRRGSGVFAQGGGVSEGGGDARRAALLTALQSGSSSLQAGSYMVEVDNYGAVKSIRLQDGDKPQPSPLGPAATTPVLVPSAAAVGTSSPAAAVATSPPAAAVQPPAAVVSAASPTVVATTSPTAAASSLANSSQDVEGAVASTPAHGSTTIGAAASRTRTAAEPAQHLDGTSTNVVDVQQLQRLLAERAAEVQVLQQQLQQLGASA